MEMQLNVKNTSFTKNKAIIHDKSKQYLTSSSAKTSTNLLASNFCDAEAAKHQDRLFASLFQF